MTPHLAIYIHLHPFTPGLSFPQPKKWLGATRFAATFDSPRIDELRDVQTQFLAEKIGAGRFFFSKNKVPFNLSIVKKKQRKGEGNDHQVLYIEIIYIYIFKAAIYSWEMTPKKHRGAEKT